jgi:hypothetical protein
MAAKKPSKKTSKPTKKTQNPVKKIKTLKPYPQKKTSKR